MPLCISGKLISLALCNGMQLAISGKELHGLQVQKSTFIFNLYSKIIPRIADQHCSNMTIVMLLILQKNNLFEGKKNFP